MSHRPFTSKQLRQAFPQLSTAARKAWLATFNAALANGMTRDEVVDLVHQIAEAYPGGADAGTMLTAFQERIIGIGGETPE